MPVKILIVDDDPNALKELPKIFTKFYPDKEIHKAKDFPTAEKLLRINRYDIVTIDHQLSKTIEPPEHRYGQNLIPIISEFSPGAKIISIADNEMSEATAKLLGVVKCLSKESLFDFITFTGKVVNSLDPNFEIQKGL